MMADESDHRLITEIKSQVDTQGAQIGMLTEGMAELTKNVNTLVQTVERNTSSNQHLGEKVDRIDARFEELEPRVRKIEQAQAVSGTKWAITGVAYTLFFAAAFGFLFYMARPLTEVGSASKQNAAMIERLTEIVDRIEARPDE